MHAEVHAVNNSDTIMGTVVAKATVKKFKTVKTFSVDMGYRGTTKNFVEKVLKCTVLVRSKIRYVVERTFAWFTNFRRHSKDYEYLTHTAEAFLYLGNIYLLLRRAFQY